MEGESDIHGIGPAHAPRGRPGLLKKYDHAAIFPLHLGDELVQSPCARDVHQRVKECLGHA